MKNCKSLLIAGAMLIGMAVMGQEETLASYAKEFKAEKPAAGWQYLWNAKGEIGAAANYSPLEWNQNVKIYSASGKEYPGPVPMNYLMLAGNSCHPGLGITAENKVQRHAIIAYSIPKGKEGKIQVAGSSVIRLLKQGENTPGGTIELRIYVNDKCMKTLTVKAGDTPVSFDMPLGELKEGDTIYMAVGPDGQDGCDHTIIDFTLKRGN